MPTPPAPPAGSSGGGPRSSRVLSHLGVMVAVSAVLGVLVAGLAIPFAGVMGLAAKQVSAGMDDLPKELETKPLDQKTRILDANGNLIASIYDENRINVPLTQMSRKMVQAIVSIEDYRFYEHGALDLRGTLRAFVSNQAADGVVQGGSSITQQLVKLTLVSMAEGNEKLQEEATEQTYARKLRELRYAIALEQNYSKDWILERYLNIAYFGDGAYGVQAAARHYFSKNAKDLSLRESALLAGLVKNPTGYDPTNNPERARARRNTVLDRMAELEVISRKRAEKTKDKPLGLDLEPTPNGCTQAIAPFFCDYVLSYLMKDKSLGRTKEDRKTLLRSGGLTIHTTLDPRFQQAAKASVDDHVYATDQAVGGLAMVEPGTGNVKALAQSRPMGKNKAEGETFLNYLVPKELGNSNGFQAGSTFKVFVLASALSQGVPPRTEMTVPAQAFIPMENYQTCGGEYTSTEVWDPSNFNDKGGTYDLYTGTQQSVNTFFARLELITGLCDPYRLAKQMGIKLTNPDVERVPSFTLGVVNTSPLEMAEAYATFAARGVHCDARPVTRIEDANGNVVKEYDTSCERVMEEPVADTVNDILAGVMAPGGFGSAIATAQPSAGKTGTTQDGKAVWFVGYTPNLATAAMIAGANSSGQPIPLAGQVVGGDYVASASGSGVAGPMWGEAMGVIEQYLEDQSFVPPDTSQLLEGTEAVPVVNGMSPEAARAQLEDAGFNAFVNDDFVNSEYSYGTVAYTSPSGGSFVPGGSIITIYVSNGVAPAPPAPPPSTGGGGDGGPDPSPGDGGPGGGNPGGGGPPGGGNPGNGNGNGRG